VTTSLTWTFDSRLALVSCGIDSELVARFRKWEKTGKNLLPFVYTPKERDHCLGLKDPAAGLCAAFCVKEALYKALERPYNFTDCEFLYAGTPQNSRFELSGKIAPGIRSGHACAKLIRPVKGQLTAIVYLFSVV
jgi:phosphopantetheinyl transferase (holo-ACP synthase)